MLRFQCPHCSAKMTAPEARAGTQAVCPACRARFSVPQATTALYRPGPASPPLPNALTATCPGCGRQIPLTGTHELLATIECARCGTRFVPATGRAPAAPVQIVSQGPPASKRWPVVVALGAAVVAILALAGLVFVLAPVAAPSAKDLIVGEWEEQGESDRTVLAFDRDGTLTLTAGGIRSRGRYRFKSGDQVEMEISPGGILGATAVVGTNRVSFPERNRMAIFYTESGTTREWKRLR